MVEKNSPVVVQWMGQKVTLKARGDQAHVQACLALVQERLEMAQKRCSKHSSSHQVVLLALMDLAEEYVSAKKRAHHLFESVQHKTQQLLTELNIEDTTQTNSA